ncbi:L-threonylcarbamoyladenylate synthase [Gabonibacter chumensis]|uniref:L-threonylcarbamoyladenylate synthase n=1 Tax=Gabonibacter chumensis TaxID=2972474 RepID=UPI0025734E26|nr:L-threonylcarbamoyladenylate synthase [Gabonibacter chumensis]MCR9012923.1 L-threonylcarbamoyladenylate synthase [Gabonibacter chumensis]
MFVRLFEDNPNEREIRKIVDLLHDGGVIIYPTDTIYAIGCDINNVKAVQRVSAIRGVKAEKANFSMICKDLSNISIYAKVNNEVFRTMKQYIPGPYTFVLPATNKLPNVLMNKRKTIGIRVPNNFIVQAIVKELDGPLLTTSVKGGPDEEVEYITDPELIHEKYEKLVDLVIDGGYGKNVPSTVLDCTGDEIAVIRQGLGEL